MNPNLNKYETKIMRTLNELYLIFWNYIKDKRHISSLCWCIDDLYRDNIISNNECAKLRNHFHANMPYKTLHSEFLESNTWRGGAWWWNGDEAKNPKNRKAFVKKMMTITKTKIL